MRRPLKGMTLLEVLCATALSSLLMVGLLGVIGGIAKTEKTLMGRNPTPDWQRRMIERLERDLGAAEQIQNISDGFRLTGPLASHPRSGTSMWTAATVDYLIADSSLGPVLLRRETASTLGAEPRHELIAYQTAQLLLLLSSEPLPLDPLTNFNSDAKAIVTILSGPPPATLRFVLLDSQGNVTLDRLVTRP